MQRGKEIHTRCHDFQKHLISALIDSVEMDRLEEEFRQILKIDQIEAIKAFKELCIYFNTETNNDNIGVKILRLIQRFDYNELPCANLFVSMILETKSLKVYSVALEVLSHWGNQEAIKIINQYEVPNNPWIKIKYTSVKNSLEKYMEK